MTGHYGNRVHVKVTVTRARLYGTPGCTGNSHRRKERRQDRELLSSASRRVGAFSHFPCRLCTKLPRKTLDDAFSGPFWNYFRTVFAFERWFICASEWREVIAGIWMKEKLLKPSRGINALTRLARMTARNCPGTKERQINPGGTDKICVRIAASRGDCSFFSKFRHYPRGEGGCFLFRVTHQSGRKK